VAAAALLLSAGCGEPGERGGGGAPVREESPGAAHPSAGADALPPHAGGDPLPPGEYACFSRDGTYTHVGRLDVLDDRRYALAEDGGARHEAGAYRYDASTRSVELDGGTPGDTRWRGAVARREDGGPILTLEPADPAGPPGRHCTFAG
jgi:hypothetical protein